MSHGSTYLVLYRNVATVQIPNHSLPDTRCAIDRSAAYAYVRVRTRAHGRPGMAQGYAYPFMSCRTVFVCRLFSLRRISCDELEYWVQPDDAASSLDQDTDTAASTILHNYFRLGHSLHSLYKQWASSDTNFALKSASCRGIRLLNQHPLESLVAFICSSNNNIQRIHSMMIKLTEAFGTHLGCHGDQDYYGFPSLSSLCVAGVESRLRDMGFGYRAKYVHQTSLKLSQELGGEKWLEDLKKIPYQGMHAQWNPLACSRAIPLKRGYLL